MRKIRVITDSGSDIINNTREDLTILPLTVSFNDTDYLDGKDITFNEFYEKLVESDELPRTSQVNPFRFEEAYEEAVSNGEDVIVITLSSKLSGTYNSAVIASEDYSEHIFVVDSENIAIAQRSLVDMAFRYIEEGLPIQTIVEKLNEDKKKLRVVAVLDTLEYLKKGGRISNTTAFVGTLLNIKPVVTVVDGLVQMLGKARGSKQGNNFLNQQLEDCGGPDYTKPIYVGYSGLSDVYAQKYVEDSSKHWDGIIERPTIHQIGSAIGTHVGPGTVAVSFFSK